MSKSIGFSLAEKLTIHLAQAQLSPNVQVVFSTLFPNATDKFNKELFHHSHPLVLIKSGGAVLLYIPPMHRNSKSVGPSAKEITDYRLAMKHFLAGYQAALMEY